MDLYSFSLVLGAVGLASMAFLGLGARSGHGSQGHDAGGGHAGAHDAGHEFGPSVGHAGHHAGHHAGPGGPPGGHPGGHDAQAAHAHQVSGHAHADSLISRAAFALLSPRVLFSLLVGFGATGTIARQVLGGPFLLGVAIGGGLAFELAVIAPLWRVMMRFASNPALTLESAITDEVHATTGFDEQGQGMISLEVDGQIAQVLATLRPDDRSMGIRVRAGDRLRVEAVDSARNQCTVSFIAAGP